MAMRDRHLVGPEWKLRPLRRDGAVYFARQGDCVKIGFSTTPRSRLKLLQIGSAVPITMLGAMRGTMATEHALHDQFRDLHVRGEWFRADPRLLRFIEKIAPIAELGADPADGAEAWDRPRTRQKQ